MLPRLRWAIGRGMLAGGGVLSAASAQSSSLCEARGCPPDVHAELSKLRSEELLMRQKWEEDEDHWHLLPPRAWPAQQPKAAELGALRQKADAACPANASAPWWLVKDCMSSKFELATCLVFGGAGAAEGLARYRTLAEHGDGESMVGVGVTLLEGIGRDLDDASTAEGLRWLRRASELGVAQARYELAVLFYVGEAGHVPCDEAAAFALFEAAAAQQHTAALFMTAECLLEGHGVAKDPARAVGLLHQAAMRGHRMARAYLREWLDEDAEKPAPAA